MTAGPFTAQNAGAAFFYLLNREMKAVPLSAQRGCGPFFIFRSGFRMGPVFKTAAIASKGALTVVKPKCWTDEEWRRFCAVCLFITTTDDEPIVEMLKTLDA